MSAPRIMLGTILFLTGTAHAEPELGQSHAVPSQVTVRLESAGEPLDIGVARETNGPGSGRRFELVCHTPCAVTFPTTEPQVGNLQARSGRSPGAALDLDARALNGSRLTLQPPEKKKIRAGAALLAVGLITSAVGGVLMPFGKEVAGKASADLTPFALPGAGLTFGAGITSSIAGVLLLATSKPKVRHIERANVDRPRG